MNAGYKQAIDEEQLSRLVAGEKWDEAFEELAQPLHQWLYEEQDFQALVSRSPIEQVLLAFDYVQSQVGQGGFIQLIQNGYISLLVMIIENLQALLMNTEMIRILDEVLKVFVLNKDDLAKETTVEEFGRLYGEYQEFSILEEQFNLNLNDFRKMIVQHTMA